MAGSLSDRQCISGLTNTPSLSGGWENPRCCGDLFAWPKSLCESVGSADWDHAAPADGYGLGGECR